MLEQLIQDYGYWAILIGTFLEGETILVLGGVAAHAGYLELHLVMASGFTGSIFGDQLYYYIGRRFGWDWLTKHEAWRPRVARLQNLMDRWHSWLIVSIRFLYGLRIAGPFVFGMAKVPPFKYLYLNAIGAFIWAISFAGAGYWIGVALARWLGNAHEVLVYGLSALLVYGIGHWLYTRWKSKHAHVTKDPVV